MESGDERDGVIMFSDEDLCEMSGLKRGRDFIEVMCGCTSQRYGDAVGRLKVFASGDLEISCECTPGCQEDKLSPSAFEKHSGREGTRKWKSNVWVMVKGEKVSLAKTVLLKYYNDASKNGNGSHKGHNGRPCHRDEFIRCSRCSKERRFRLRTKEECRIYHDASADINWNCSDLASDKFFWIKEKIHITTTVMDRQLRLIPIPYRFLGLAETSTNTAILNHDTDDQDFGLIYVNLSNGDLGKHPHYSIHDGFLFKGTKLCHPATSMHEYVVRELHS